MDRCWSNSWPMDRLTADRRLLEYPAQPSGNSSVGRAQPCQGWGREFESRFPLQIPHRSTTACLHRWCWLGLSGRVVMQRPAKPCTPVRFRPQPPFLRFTRAPHPAFTSRMCLSMLPASIARVAELADAADSSGSPTWKRVGAQGVKFGEPLTGRADGDPELSPCGAWESVETRRPLPKCLTAYGKGIVQTTERAAGAQ